MKKIFYVSYIFCFLSISCNQKTNNSCHEKLVKIEITDSCFKSILTDYIEAFPFNGKGIYFTTIKSSIDTTKYFIDVIFTEQDLDIALKGVPYYNYDIINQRIIIIYTKFEKHLENKFAVYECDTILNKYFDNTPDAALHNNVYRIEFTKLKDTITRKVIRYDPF